MTSQLQDNGLNDIIVTGQAPVSMTLTFQYSTGLNTILVEPTNDRENILSVHLHYNTMHTFRVGNNGISGLTVYWKHTQVYVPGGSLVRRAAWIARCFPPCSYASSAQRPWTTLAPVETEGTVVRRSGGWDSQPKMSAQSSYWLSLS